MDFYIVMNATGVIKGITTEQQERALDVFKTCTMVDNVIRELEELRVDPTVFAQWFAQIKSLAESVGQTIAVPRLTGRQVHRSNQPHRDPKE